MAKQKEMYCGKCGESTPHSYVGSESDIEETGICRGIMAVVSLGLSEAFLRDKYWRCEKCGNVSEDD